MGETERAYAPGNFVSLSKGLVHYRWFGEKHNDLVVCVHGLTTPSFVFESLAEYYVKSGKCVLVFDNYGRGYSDRPKGKQDKEFFINQLDELLDKLDLNKEKFELVGYSMGGSIASAYAYAEAIDPPIEYPTSSNFSLLRSSLSKSSSN